jgi:anion-transporting  ArsA/GET3 family ATPase
VKKAPKYDVVIVDAPATGHGLGILRTPKTFGDIARVGPIKRQAEAIHEFITDPKLTAICAVAWPEEMPVNETLDLQRSLRKELGMKLSQIYMNGLYPELFSDREARALSAHLERNGSESGPAAPLRRAAVRAAVSEHRRARAHREQLERLQDGTRRPVVELPFLFTEQLDMDAVGQLADTLEPAL